MHFTPFVNEEVSEDFLRHFALSFCLVSYCSAQYVVRVCVMWVLIVGVWEKEELQDTLKIQIYGEF